MAEQTKTLEINVLTIKELLVLKCIEDVDFRQKFLANPKETIEQEFKIKLPKEAQFKVFEDTDSLIHIALPSKKALDPSRIAHVELSDQEIQSISGGGPMSGAMSTAHMDQKGQFSALAKLTGEAMHATGQAVVNLFK